MAKKDKEKGVRVSAEDLDKARKKIKETPKRGRWPRWDSILNFKDFIHMSDVPDIRRTCKGMAVFDKLTHLMGGGEYIVENSFVRFTCESYDGAKSNINDLICIGEAAGLPYSDEKVACPRTTCPYNKKGFITTALETQVFKKEVDYHNNHSHDMKNK